MCFTYTYIILTFHQGFFYMAEIIIICIILIFGFKILLKSGIKKVKMLEIDSFERGFNPILLDYNLQSIDCITSDDTRFVYKRKLIQV